MNTEYVNSGKKEGAKVHLTMIVGSVVTMNVYFCEGQLSLDVAKILLCDLVEIRSPGSAN